MLARRARRRRHNNSQARRFCTPDMMQVSEGYANPQSPIPVILQRDEELGLHHNHVDHDDDDDLYGNDDEQEEIHIPRPPPAYGLWRSSVVRLHAPPRAHKDDKKLTISNKIQRADPNLLHWQARSPEMIQKLKKPSSSHSPPVLRGGELPRPPCYTMESETGAMDVPVVFFGDDERVWRREEVCVVVGAAGVGAMKGWFKECFMYVGI